MPRMTEKEFEEYGKKTVIINRHDFVDIMISQIAREREMMEEAGLDLPAKLLLEGMYRNFCIAVTHEVFKDENTDIFNKEEV